MEQRFRPGRAAGTTSVLRDVVMSSGGRLL
jgi:hypothetical protein